MLVGFLTSLGHRIWSSFSRRISKLQEQLRTSHCVYEKGLISTWGVVQTTRGHCRGQSLGYDGYQWLKLRRLRETFTFFGQGPVRRQWPRWLGRIFQIGLSPQVQRSLPGNGSPLILLTDMLLWGKVGDEQIFWKCLGLTIFKGNILS